MTLTLQINTYVKNRVEAPTTHGERVWEGAEAWGISCLAATIVVTMHTDKEPFWRLPLWKPGQNKGKNIILQLGLQCNILWLGLTLYHTHNYYMIGLRPLTWQIYIDSRAGKGHKPSVHTADPPPALFLCSSNT